MKRVTLVLFVFNFYLLFGQIQDSLFEIKMNSDDMNGSEKNEKFIFLDFQASGPFCEVLRIKPKTIYRAEYDYISAINDYGIVDSVEVSDKGLMVSILSVTVSPRINLISNYSSSLFIKFPISFGLSLTYPGSVYYSKSWGVFNFNCPVLVGYGKNLNSSAENASKSGFSISFGGQFIKGPMIGAIRDLEDYPNYEPRRKWIMPLVQGDYFWLTRKRKMKGVSLSFSPFPIYFKASLTFSSNLIKIL